MLPDCDGRVSRMLRNSTTAPRVASVPTRNEIATRTTFGGTATAQPNVGLHDA